MSGFKASPHLKNHIRMAGNSMTYFSFKHGNMKFLNQNNILTFLTLQKSFSVNSMTSLKHLSSSEFSDEYGRPNTLVV